MSIWLHRITFIREKTTLFLSSAALVNKLLLLYKNMQRLRDFSAIYLSFRHSFMSPFFFEATANSRQPFLSVGDALKRDLLGWTLVISLMGLVYLVSQTWRHFWTAPNIKVQSVKLRESWSCWCLAEETFSFLTYGSQRNWRVQWYIVSAFFSLEWVVLYEANARAKYSFGHQGI